METDSVPADKADKAADPAEETEWPKKQKLFETNNNRCRSDKKESGFKYYFVAKKFSEKNKKKDVGEMRRHLFLLLCFRLWCFCCLHRIERYIIKCFLLLLRLVCSAERYGVQRRVDGCAAFKVAGVQHHFVGDEWHVEHVHAFAYLAERQGEFVLAYQRYVGAVGAVLDGETPTFQLFRKGFVQFRQRFVVAKFRAHDVACAKHAYLRHCHCRRGHVGNFVHCRLYVNKVVVGNFTQETKRDVVVCGRHKLAAFVEVAQCL